ncbi:MAG TPA: DoxX family protein [Chryseolinea sp.]
MKTIPTILYWGARLLAALILLQTLFFKFTASAESVYIFTKVGMEPWGRIMVGILELIAGVMLVIPRTAWMGATLALGLMTGAIGMHLTLLGIDVQGDGGYLFFLALLVTICSAYTLTKNLDKITGIVSLMREKIS